MKSGRRGGAAPGRAFRSPSRDRYERRYERHSEKVDHLARQPRTTMGAAASVPAEAEPPAEGAEAPPKSADVPDDHKALVYVGVQPRERAVIADA